MGLGSLGRTPGRAERRSAVPQAIRRGVDETQVSPGWPPPSCCSYRRCERRPRKVTAGSASSNISRRSVSRLVFPACRSSSCRDRSGRLGKRPGTAGRRRARRRRTRHPLSPRRPHHRPLVDARPVLHRARRSRARRSDPSLRAVVSDAVDDDRRPPRAYQRPSAPQGAFRHDLSRFSALGAVVEACDDRPFSVSMGLGLFDRAAMTGSVPGMDAFTASPSVLEALGDATCRATGGSLASSRDALPRLGQRQSDPLELSDDCAVGIDRRSLHRRATSPRSMPRSTAASCFVVTCCSGHGRGRPSTAPPRRTASAGSSRSTTAS